jgi:hypothetical protein
MKGRRGPPPMNVHPSLRQAIPMDLSFKNAKRKTRSVQLAISSRKAEAARKASLKKQRKLLKDGRARRS